MYRYVKANENDTGKYIVREIDLVDDASKGFDVTITSSTTSNYLEITDEDIEKIQSLSSCRNVYLTDSYTNEHDDIQARLQDALHGEYEIDELTIIRSLDVKNLRGKFIADNEKLKDSVLYEFTTKVKAYRINEDGKVDRRKSKQCYVYVYCKIISDTIGGDTGVGLVSFHLADPEKLTEEDILLESVNSVPDFPQFVEGHENYKVEVEVDWIPYIRRNEYNVTVYDPDGNEIEYLEYSSYSQERVFQYLSRNVKHIIDNIDSN